MKGRRDISRWILRLCFQGMWGACAGVFMVVIVFYLVS